MDNVRELSNEMLITNLDNRIEFESANEAEIIDYIREVMYRRMCGKLGANNMFDFLTRARYKYPRNIAMRKLDAARTMQNFPQIKQWLFDGELNLSQLEMFQKAVRQKSPTLELQAEILEEIRNHTLENTQFILCEKLGLEIKKHTKVRVQRDGSVRAEITFTAEQWASIMRAKEVLSHSIPSGDPAEVICYCTDFTFEKKNPAAPAKRKSTRKKPQDPKPHSAGDRDQAAPADHVDKACDKPAAAPDSKETSSQSPSSIPETGVRARHKRKVSRASRRITFQKHNGCQFRHPDGTQCGSRYQLQVDHIVSLYAGGSNDPGNLQILCGVHNREKFRRESEMERGRSNTSPTE